MWTLPPFNKQCIIIHFSPHHITCSWFQQDNNKTRLKAIKTHPLENLELERLIVFNPSYISSIIQAFLDEHQLHHAFSLFGLNGPSLHEQFITLDTATPHPKILALHSKSNNVDWDKLVWDYSYMYPSDDNKFIFYAAGITREILFQYQLLAMKNYLNLVAISPATMGFLALYKQYQGNQFRHSQLGIELRRHNNNASQLFSESMIHEMVTFNPENINNDNIHAFLASLGLYFMRNTIDA